MSEIRPPHDIQASFCATLVDQWVAEGVRTAFVAPGSRSTPMALALVARREIEVRVVIDERTAGFAAVGAGIDSGIPAIALCTSGTAATHFHGAVVEADLSGVPLIVVTADRPPELRDVGAPQTIDQTKLFGSSVRWFHDPGVAAVESESSWRSLARRAVWSATGVDRGPVHLNLPFREPLLGSAKVVGVADVLSRQVVGSVAGVDEILDLATMISGLRGIIVVGRGGPNPETLDSFAGAIGWPMFVEPRAGCSTSVHAVAHFDSVVRAVQSDPTMTPEVVLRLGDAPASKVLAQWVAGSGARQIHVGSSARPYDADHGVAVRVVGSTDHVVRDLSRHVTAAPGEWAAKWQALSTNAATAVDQAITAHRPLNPVSLAWHLPRLLPSGTNLVVSSSMPIRNLEWFGSPCDHLRVHANRGANGIDGVVATALGVAVSSGRPTAVSIGDVALIHDLSSIAALAALRADVTLVVSDNDGGGIFEFLPQAANLDRDSFEQLFGTPHGIDVVAVLNSLGVPAVEVDTPRGLAEALGGSGPRAVVVRSDRTTDVDVHRALQAVVAEAVAG